MNETVVPFCVALRSAELSDRLRQDEPPLGLDLKESVCPACNLAYWTAAGTRGVCHDCARELELI